MKSLHDITVYDKIIKNIEKKKWINLENNLKLKFKKVSFDTFTRNSVNFTKVYTFVT